MLRKYFSLMSCVKAGSALTHGSAACLQLVDVSVVISLNPRGGNAHLLLLRVRFLSQQVINCSLPAFMCRSAVVACHVVMLIGRSMKTSWQTLAFYSSEYGSSAAAGINWFSLNTFAGSSYRGWWVRGDVRRVMFISRTIQSPVIRIGLRLIVPVCPVSSISAAAV